MVKITDIYQKYQLLPNLQQHQLRVAAVAKQICDNLDSPADTEAVIKACLLHDMGNIIKFDLSQFSEFLEPEGPGYWQKVQAQFKTRYGDDEHHATIEIAKELGVKSKIVELIDGIGFSNSLVTVSQKKLEPKICAYADMRVAPNGVLSLDERLADGRRRYANRPKYIDDFDKYVAAFEQIEKQVFENLKIKASDITDESVAPIIKELKTWQI